MKVKAKISDYLFFQEGPGVRNTQYTTKGVKLLNVSNLVDGQIDLSNSDRYISEKEANGKYKHFLVDEGDLIIASSGIKVDYLDKKIGFIKKEHLPLCMNTSTIRFKVLDNKILNIKYFKYYLQSNDFKVQVSRSITGSAQLNYGPSHLKQMNFILYDLNKQKDIVEKLDKINNLIQKCRKVMDYLDTLIKARFVEMFGDGMKNSNYEKCAIGDMCEIVTGTTPDTADEKCWNGNINWITPAEIPDNILYYGETVRKITEYGLKSKALKIMPIGTVVFSTRAPIGKTCILKYESACNQGFKNCICKEDINNIYLYCIFKNNTKFFNDLGTGATFKEISKSEFEKVIISIPPIKLQNQFATFVQHIDKLKFDVQKSLEKTQMLFDSLMQEYFN